MKWRMNFRGRAYIIEFEQNDETQQFDVVGLELIDHTAEAVVINRIPDDELESMSQEQDFRMAMLYAIADYIPGAPIDMRAMH